MNCLYGLYRPTEGAIRVNGRALAITDPNVAIRHGIGMVHQHFMLVEPFTVLENVVLGAEDGALLRPSLAKARSELTRLAEEYELQVDPDAVVGDLSVGFQQRVEILKALYRRADILILDEPTGVLTPSEADHLFRILKSLRDEGKTVGRFDARAIGRDAQDLGDYPRYFVRCSVIKLIRSVSTQEFIEDHSRE